MGYLSLKFITSKISFLGVNDIKKVGFKILLVFALICFILLVNIAYASDSDINQPMADDNFDAIQSLIDDASSGDSIYLEDRTYCGNGSAVTINKDITIYGLNSSSTILDANKKSSIFKISKGVTVNLIGLTLVNGNAFKDDGGAIYNSGKLTITNSTISDSYASAGGAIYCTSYASLTVYNSMFDSNHANSGGGVIDNYQSDLKVINSTFVNNVGHEGGAIYNRYSNFWIYDSVFANNSATRGGGVYNNKGLMKIYNSEFYSNTASHLGGGIKSFGDCEVHNTIVKNNTAYQGGGLFVSQNTMRVINCTVEDNTAYEGGGFFTDVKASLIIKQTSIVNNSAEVDGGGINVYQGYLTLTNSNLTGNYAPNCGGAIFYSDYPYTSTISNLKMTNNNAKYGGAVYVGTLTVKMNNIEFTGNSATDGGAIYNTGSLTSNDIRLNSNKASRTGGAIYSNNDLTISNSKANKNNAAMYGGAIYSDANLNINNIDCTSNEAKYAGAIYSGKAAKITDSNFDANKAYDTGAIYSGSDLIIDRCTFTNQQVTHSYGGALMLLKGNVNINNSVFSNNKGADEGGSIFNDIANVYINNTIFSSNNAKSYGAAIDNSGKMTVENSAFDKNQAYGAGAIDNGGDFKIINSSFTNNKANSNNGGAIDNNGNMTIVGSVFENNLAKNNGGAIIARRNIDVSHSIFYNNHDKRGYAVFNDTWEDISFSDNWWGLNNPDFDQLFNFNPSDDFTWILMNVTNNTELIQGKSADIRIDFNTVSYKDNSTSKLDSPELLPSFEVTISNGDVLSVEKGSASKSINLPKAPTVSFTAHDQTMILSLGDDIKRISDNEDVVVEYPEKATFKVRVMGDDGKPVGKGVVITMKVGDTSYEVTTDENGYASKTFDYPSGEYTVVTTYMDYSVENTLTIKNASDSKSDDENGGSSEASKNGLGKQVAGKVHFTDNGQYISIGNSDNLKLINPSNIVKQLNYQIKAKLFIEKLFSIFYSLPYLFLLSFYKINVPLSLIHLYQIVDALLLFVN